MRKTICAYCGAQVRKGRIYRSFCSVRHAATYRFLQGLKHEPAKFAPKGKES